MDKGKQVGGNVMVTKKNYWSIYIVTFILFWCFRLSPLHKQYAFLDWPFMMCFVIIAFIGFVVGKKEDKKDNNSSQD